ncbi:hypothetical protein AKJ16_DCAP25866, partial [Drosera capensis]
MNLGVSSSSSAAAASKPDDEVWAKLVPSDSKYPGIGIRSDDTLICSEITPASSDKHDRCQIIRNSDLCSGTLENKSNGCFSEWLRRCQQKHSSDILHADSSLRRSAEDLATLDKCASIKSNLVVSSRTRGRKRPQSMISESDISTVPSDESRCDRAFFGAYWYDLGVSADDNYPLCIPDTFKHHRTYTKSNPTHPIAHEGNPYEQEITERSIALKRTTLLALVSEMVTKLDLRQIGNALYSTT